MQNWEKQIRQSLAKIDAESRWELIKIIDEEIICPTDPQVPQDKRLERVFDRIEALIKRKKS